MFSERIEQDIPDSCLFSKIESLIEYELGSQRARSSDNRDLEDRDDVSSTLNWSNAISTDTNLTGAFNSLDGLRLGALSSA
ncbi:hypothetical protein VCRA217O315_160105 [Vibrio crassostreae]|nr:hypothetical protein VCRA217O315_160105 [Vibrio crassostreae]